MERWEFCIFLSAEKWQLPSSFFEQFVMVSSFVDYCHDQLLQMGYASDIANMKETAVWTDISGETNDY